MEERAREIVFYFEDANGYQGQEEVRRRQELRDLAAEMTDVRGMETGDFDLDQVLPVPAEYYTDADLLAVLKLEKDLE